MLIQYNLTSSVIYAQAENTNNALCVFFHMGDICLVLSMDWSEIILWKMIKHVFKLIQNIKLTRNMIGYIFQSNCIILANAANLKWNNIFIQSLCRVSALWK